MCDNKIHGMYFEKSLMRITLKIYNFKRLFLNDFSEHETETVGSNIAESSTCVVCLGEPREGEF